MPRLIPAFEQFFDSAGDPLVSGLIDFFEAGSSTVRKTTYADASETITNSNPLVLLGDGRTPNVWGTGNFRAVLRTSGGTQILSRDPIGGDETLDFGADWKETQIYSETDVVRDGGQYWQSEVNGNLGNKPSTDSGTNWESALIGTSEVLAAVDADRPIVATYAEMDALPALSTGTKVTLTGDGIAGDWVVDDDASLVANVGTLRSWSNAVGNQKLRRLDANNEKLNVRWFGAEGDGTTDDRTAVFNAASYLLGLTWPGGALYFPKTDEPYIIGSKIDFLEILFTEQGLTFPPTTTGTTLPNGEIVRNVSIGIVGDVATIKTTASYSDPYLFKFGHFVDLSAKQSMKFYIEDIEFIGPGSIGHSATEYLTGGAGGFTTAADVNKGTDDTVVTCIQNEENVPGTYLKGTHIRLFNKAVECTFGFGLEYESGSIQFCNYGVHCLSGYTNLNLGPSLELELCGVALFLEKADATTIVGTVIEANVCDVLLWLARFIEFEGAWFEASTDEIVIRSDTASASLFNRQINFKGCVGPSKIDSNGGLVGMNLQRCALGNDYSFGASTGNPFSDIVFDKCTFGNTAAGFDLDGLTVSGTAVLEDIRVIGSVQNQGLDDFGVRDTLKLKGSTVSASAAAVRAFDVLIPNIETTARIEIVALKKAALSADMRRQSARYVGVITRFVGATSIVEFSTTESLVSNYNTTGTNAPITVAVPTVTITGAVGVEQTIEIEFPTGTAVSGSAETYWEVTMQTEVGDVRFQR